ncbi:MAG: DNA-directed RNA polymerase subunit alpha [bacterium]
MIDFSDLNVEVVENDGSKGVFKIGPLPKGFGNTLANSLRRVLLSSLEGSGVTSIKISGVDHEYSTIEGVKETVIEILLNLKNVRFQCDSNDPQIVKVSVKGPADVKAGDFDVTESVIVMNPKAVVATVTGKGTKFDMEMTVERGIGYQLGDEEVRSEVGRLPVDTKFSPVERVMYKVDEARKGGRIDFDLITISVFTDGSIDPKDAIIKSSNILMDLTERVVAISGGKAEVKKEKSNKKKKSADKSKEEGKVLIGDIELSTRTKSALVNAGIDTVENLTSKTEDEVKDIKGFGTKAFDEVTDYLKSNKLELKK